MRLEIGVMIHNINKLHLKIKKLLFLVVRTFQNIKFFLYFWSQKMQPLQAFLLIYLFIV